MLKSKTIILVAFFILILVSTSLSFVVDTQRRNIKELESEVRNSRATIQSLSKYYSEKDKIKGAFDESTTIDDTISIFNDYWGVR